jgi:hypothetical protein
MANTLTLFEGTGQQLLIVALSLTLLFGVGPAATESVDATTPELGYFLSGGSEGGAALGGAMGGYAGCIGGGVLSSPLGPGAVTGCSAGAFAGSTAGGA